MQVEKLRALFWPITVLPEPITVLPESAPSFGNRHYVDNMHPAPSTAYVSASGSHPTQPAINRHLDPSTAYFPPSASHPTHPAAYVHYPGAYVPAQAAHLVSHEPYSRLPPPSAQFTSPAYYPYQAGFEAYGPLPAAYHYAQAPPSCYSSVQTQHLVPQHVSHPVYSTEPYCTKRDDPYLFDAVNSHCQETTSERTAYSAAHGNLQLVRQYGYTPSSESAAPEAAITNLGLVRSYGSAPSITIEGTTQSNVDEAAPAIYSYAGASATTQAENVAAPSVYVVTAAPAYP